MLQNAYLLAKIGADTAENERNVAEILPKIGHYPTAPLRLCQLLPAREVTEELLAACGTTTLASMSFRTGPSTSDRGTTMRMRPRPCGSHGLAIGCAAGSSSLETPEVSDDDLAAFARVSNPQRGREGGRGRRRRGGGSGGDEAPRRVASFTG